jgi:hypothetical protein
MGIEVLSVQPRVDVTPAGDLIHVYHIRFRTEKGAIGTLMVPQEGFDPDRVRELIREKAAQLDSLFEV